MDTSPFRILDLPPELAIECLTHCPQSDLLSLLLTSRALHLLSRPVLYADPSFVTDAGPLVRRLIENPELCPLVQRLISAVTPPECETGDPARVQGQDLLWTTWLGPFGTIAPACTALRTFTLWSFGRLLSLPEAAIALEALPALSSLELGHLDPSCPARRPVVLPQVKTLVCLDLVCTHSNPGFRALATIFPSAREVTLNLYLYTFRPADFEAVRSWSSVRFLSLDSDAVPIPLLDALASMPGLERLDLTISAPPSPESFDRPIPSLTNCTLLDLPSASLLEFASSVSKDRFPRLERAVLGCGRGTERWTEEEEGVVKAWMEDRGFWEGERHQSAPDSEVEREWIRRKRPRRVTFDGAFV